jgi:hypothetical protein
MPQAEKCSYCFVQRLQIMQNSAYSIYNDFFKARLDHVKSACSLSMSTDIPSLLFQVENKTSSYCPGINYTSVSGDTCNSIATAKNISSAGLFMSNQDILVNCTSITSPTELCLPLQCSTHTVTATERCVDIELANNLTIGRLRDFNPWLDLACSNLHTSAAVFGNVVCVSALGNATASPAAPQSNSPTAQTGYVLDETWPPEGAILAVGTNLTNCGRWYQYDGVMSCAAICLQQSITAKLFMDVNRSLSASNCTASLVQGKTYCVGPIYGWDDPHHWDSEQWTTTDGSCNNQTTCSLSGFGRCCNKSGTCGNDQAHCGWENCNPRAGDCDPKPIGGIILTTDGTCGDKSVGQMTCANSTSFGICCSSSGVCGSTSEYCVRANCQTGYGHCDGTNGTVTSSTQTSLNGL